MHCEKVYCYTTHLLRCFDITKRQLVYCNQVLQRGSIGLFYKWRHCLLVQVHKSLQRVKEREMARFIDWGPASMQVRAVGLACLVFFAYHFGCFGFG